MFAKKAVEMDDRDSQRGDNRKRGRDEASSNAGEAKRARAERPDRILSNDDVRDAITPLWRKEYTEQLDEKAKEMVNKCSKKIVQEVKRKFRLVLFI
jgi:hypothetical protein